METDNFTKPTAAQAFSFRINRDNFTGIILTVFRGKNGAFPFVERGGAGEGPGVPDLEIFDKKGLIEPD